ncbi:VOC family protein [Streptomyces palmae]|uniref:VOC family protein n=1 Tax=Streptomyces palmae TaxID=1701085 RepID=A0A4Z0HCA8_9ACTN|nr:VOC family protein [Streptomyces palmae]TGB10705.1 VOC family protein [Streptomyces palmae]
MTIAALRTGHVGLNVTDLDRAIGFYTPVFGFEVIGKGVEEDRRYAFLGRDGKLVLTLWQQATGGFDGTRAGLHHLSFEVDTLEEVRAAEDRLRELGAEFAYDGVVAHREGAASGGIFFTDPDGTRLEIYAPTGVEGAPAPAEAAPTCGFF